MDEPPFTNKSNNNYAGKLDAGVYAAGNHPCLPVCLVDDYVPGSLWVVTTSQCIRMYCLAPGRTVHPIPGGAGWSFCDDLASPCRNQVPIATSRRHSPEHPPPLMLIVLMKTNVQCAHERMDARILNGH